MKYNEQVAETTEEQSSMSRDEVMDLMKKRSEYQLDLDNLPKSEHNWVDRGAVISCEGVHQNHRHFKKR
jgi:hypothetical protein